jgi:molybdopterin synthase catalytic subunit
MENELKAILKEIVNDLEQVRIALARRVEKSTDQSTTAVEIVAGANREAYNAIRKRIDDLRTGV